MLTIGIIAEGPTDQIVIENILQGYFQNEEIAVNYFYPPLAVSGATPPPAGWTLVFTCLRRGYVQLGLQVNQYLAIHIDADVQKEPGFDVPRQENGKKLTLHDRVDRIIERLRKEIDPEVLKTKGERILFAIAVDSIECWLLPLLFLTDHKKASKEPGCLDLANKQLRKMNLKGLSSSKEAKFDTARSYAVDRFCTLVRPSEFRRAS